MELYNPIIREVEALAGASTPKRYAYDPAEAWEDTGAFELVMLRDAAFELGGSGKSAVNFTCVTSSSNLVPGDEIAAGIQMAVAKRCFVMSKKAGATDAITLTGGCAKNAGLKQAIEHVLKLKVIDLKTDPQLMGALGAAEYARQKGMARA